MLRAMGSTGRRKGPASFSFFRVRTVDWQKRNWAVLKDDSPLANAEETPLPLTGVTPLRCIEDEAEAGGGVADLQDNISTPAEAHGTGWAYISKRRLVGV